MNAQNPDANASGNISGRNAPWINNYPEGIDWNASIDQTTLIQTFDNSIQKFGDKTFLSFFGKKMSYATFGEKAKEFAAGLQAKGVVKGSKVGICLPNTPFYPVAYYGTLLAGGIVVNINPQWAEKVGVYIKDSDMDMMVTTNLDVIYPPVEKAMLNSALKKVIVCDFSDALPFAKKWAFRAASGIRKVLTLKPNCKITGNLFAKWVKKIDAAIPPLSRISKDPRIVSFDSMLHRADAFRPVKIAPDDIAIFQYTGGTTGGEPKAAVLTHANLTANLAQANTWFNGGRNNPEKERQLVILPFSHVFAMTVQMNLSFSRGAEVIMLPKFDIKQTLEAFQTEKPTMFAGVPTLYKALIDYKSVKQYDLSSVKIWLSGAMALPKTTAEGFKALTGHDIIEGYGLSETSPLAAANPIAGNKKAGSIGLPVPQTEIRIFNFEKTDVEQPQGEVGGIWIRGPQVMREYYNNAAKTKEALRGDGFFYTGDDGYMDEQGYFFITGRSKEMSIVNGNKVYWEIVQHVALKHPDIADAAVIGMPDKNGGNDRVKIILVMREGKTIDKETLSEFLKHSLASYEIPRYLEFRDSLPKTPVGKYDKQVLLNEWKASDAGAAKPTTP